MHPHFLFSLAPKRETLQRALSPLRGSPWRAVHGPKEKRRLRETAFGRFPHFTGVLLRAVPFSELPCGSTRLTPSLQNCAPARLVPCLSDGGCRMARPPLFAAAGGCFPDTSKPAAAVKEDTPFDNHPLLCRAPSSRERSLSGKHLPARRAAGRFPQPHCAKVSPRICAKQPQAVWHQPLFLSSTVHGAFSLFLGPEKERMGGASPRPERSANPRPLEKGKTKTPGGAIPAGVTCRKVNLPVYHNQSKTDRLAYIPALGIAPLWFPV